MCSDDALLQAVDWAAHARVVRKSTASTRAETKGGKLQLLVSLLLISTYLVAHLYECVMLRVRMSVLILFYVCLV